MSVEMIVSFIIEGLFAIVLFLLRMNYAEAKAKLDDVDRRQQALEVKLAGDYLNKAEFFQEFGRLREELVAIRDLIIKDLKTRKGD